MRPDQLERRLRERLDAFGPAPRAELLHVLMLPDFERAERIGEFWSYRSTSVYSLSVGQDCPEVKERTPLQEASVASGGNQHRGRRRIECQFRWESTARSGRCPRVQAANQDYC